MTPQTHLTRTITQVEAVIRQAKQALTPCGVRPPNEHEARKRLRDADALLREILN
jgi:hypothetical protein